MLKQNFVANVNYIDICNKSLYSIWYVYNIYIYNAYINALDKYIFMRILD